MTDKIQSDQINELATALSKAQGVISPAIKDSKNGFFKSTYADLSSVWNACRDALSKNGLSIIQTMDFREGQNVLITTLAHSSGQWMRSFLSIITDKNNAQGLGSAITYLRRYALSAMVGITCSEDDDDGNNACSVSDNKREELVRKPIITRDQAEEITSRLNECDDQFKQNVRNYLKSLNVDNFYLLPSENYQAILKRISNKLGEQRREQVVYD